jgi:hypothetical protein
MLFCDDRRFPLSGGGFYSRDSGFLHFLKIMGRAEIAGIVRELKRWAAG